MSATIFTVFHPESPGMRLSVRRGWLGRLFKPEIFATFRECTEYRRACEIARHDTGGPLGYQPADSKESA